MAMRIEGLVARALDTSAEAPAAVEKAADAPQVALVLGSGAPASRIYCRSVWNLGSGRFLLRAEGGPGPAVYELTCPSDTPEGQAKLGQLQGLLRGLQEDDHKANGVEAPPPNTGRGGPAGPRGGSEFSRRTEEASASMYFHYYGMLQHQQNMLQDYVRTGGYWLAILENRADFVGKTVMDVGAGTGILSLFAVQAGAAKVYAVEASEMAGFCQTLLDSNPDLGARVEVVRGRLEEVELDAQVDVLVSEPMGTLLVNERMLETYLHARRRFLRPGGLMFPSVGRIYAAPFTDEVLYNEIVAKGLFWNQAAYYGVSLQALWAPALASYMSQIVVDEVNANCLVSPAVVHTIDFRTAEEADLLDIRIPLSYKAGWQCQVHGIACWFDVDFGGTTHLRCLSTAPGQPLTHWFQLRCLLERPLVALQGAELQGELRLTAHERQSYTCHLTLTAPALALGGKPQQRTQTADLKEPYYRQLNAWYQQLGAAASAPAAPIPQPGPAPLGDLDPPGEPSDAPGSSMAGNHATTGPIRHDLLQAEAEQMLDAGIQEQQEQQLQERQRPLQEV